MRQQGFTYLAILFAVAILGAVLGATAVVWHAQVQREREQELLFVGHAFRAAIGQYYEKTPGTSKQYPKKLEDLLEDKRQATLTRHLRKIYVDPMTGNREWGLITKPDQTITGIYSLSKKAPIKSGNFSEEDKDFRDAQSYADWKFLYVAKAPPTPTLPAPLGAAPGQPPASNPAVPPGVNPSPAPTTAPNVN